MDPGKVDPRLFQVMGSLVKHLHAFIKEVEPTRTNGWQAIQFLTSTGHMCNDWRQEFILLSDMLGSRCWSTRSTTASRRAPPKARCSARSTSRMRRSMPMGANICLDDKGEDMLIDGRILDTEGRPIAGARARRLAGQ